MKKLTSILLILMLFFSTSLSVNAHTDKNVDVTVTNTATELTRNEFIEMLSQKKGITLSEAELEVEKITKDKIKQFKKSSESISPLSLPEGQMYYTYTSTKDFGCGYTVEAGALVILYNQGSFREIIDVVEEWTGATGSGSYEWDEFYVYSNHTSTSLDLLARGAIVVAVDHSTSGGVDFGSDLLGVGFNVSHSIGQTYYYRKVSSWSSTWYLYQP